MSVSDYQLTGPSHMLEMIDPLITTNFEFAVVGIDMFNDVIQSVNILNEVQVSEFIAQELQSVNTYSEAEAYVFVRGIDSKPDANYREAISKVESWNNVLDILKVDFKTKTYVSEMCDSIACCDPDNPNQYMEVEEELSFEDFLAQFTQ